eukprot:TRINITY_DN57212_c0_g1_i1.p2 TRINITY_DN57212_c0_g1~~TRINITY_DN57212_c0_g1_i1.p2  ORF type:complete len:207 (+),score=5.70 TRINITY_DN57212_c0_g1_i1:84-704(+)
MQKLKTNISKPQSHQSLIGQIKRCGRKTRIILQCSQTKLLEESPDSLSLEYQSIEQQQQWRSQKLRQILSFYGPALCIPLSDPLMSLLDTVCIGQFPGTLELASLGPSSMIFAFVNNTYYMMGSYITAAVAKYLSQNDTQQAQDTSTLVVWAGIVIGIVLTALLYVLLPQLLALTKANPEILDKAQIYSSIRLLAQPAITTGKIGL